MANTKIQSEQIEDDIALGGNPTTTTQSAGNNTTRVATTAFVTTAVANLVDSAPSALDTLNELAAAMGDDASFSTTITNSIATKLPLAGGTMTGNIAHASDFTLDMGGEINLDADGGKVRFKDGGTEHLRFVMDNSGALQMYAAVADVDLKIQGLDGSSVIDALTLDMENAGKATFNNSVTASAVTSTGGMFSGGSNGGIRIHVGGAKFFNVTAANAAQDATMDIGASDARFKDLHISGVANVGTQVKWPSVSYDDMAMGLDSNGFYLYNVDDSAYRIILDDGSGNVGIGLTSGISSKLHVNTEMSLGPDANNRGIINYSSNILSFGTRQSSTNYFSTVNITGGNVGIGESSPMGRLHVKEGDSGVSSANTNFDQLILEDDQHSGMSILTGAGYHGGIYFADPDTNDVGQIKYHHNDDSLHLTVNSQERLVIESDGNTRIKTGNIVMDGSGKGIFLGGTASENLLDDYEEGTFTTAFYASSSGSLSLSSNTLAYTKVGRLVTCHGYCVVSSVSSPSGYLYFTLPFAMASGNQFAASASVSFNGLASGDVHDAWAFTLSGSTQVRVYTGVGTGAQATFAQRVQASTDVRISVTYSTT